MPEDTVKDESPVLVPLRAWWQKPPLNKCACLVLLLGIKRQDAVVHDLDDVAQSRRVDGTPGSGERTVPTDACVVYLLG